MKELAPVRTLPVFRPVKLDATGFVRTRAECKEESIREEETPEEIKGNFTLLQQREEAGTCLGIVLIEIVEKKFKMRYALLVLIRLGDFF